MVRCILISYSRYSFRHGVNMFHNLIDNGSSIRYIAILIRFAAKSIQFQQYKFKPDCSRFIYLFITIFNYSLFVKNCLQWASDNMRNLKQIDDEMTSKNMYVQFEGPLEKLCRVIVNCLGNPYRYLAIYVLIVMQVYLFATIFDIINNYFIFMVLCFYYIQFSENL